MIDEPESIKDMLPLLLNDSDSFPDRAVKTREFARNYHDSKALSGELNELLNKISCSE